jgi:hypothetical protein
MSDCGVGLLTISSEARINYNRCFKLEEMKLSGTSGVLSWLSEDSNNVIIFVNDTLYCFNRGNFAHSNIEKTIYDDDEPPIVLYYYLYDQVFNGRKITPQDYSHLFDYTYQFYKFTKSSGGLYKVCAYTLEDYKEASRRLY